MNREAQIESMTILLVEDHPDTREAMNGWFKRRGHTVLEACDMKSALGVGRKMPFDLLICDLKLPDGDGWRLDGSRVAERGQNALYHQRPDGSFQDVTDQAGVGGEGEWGAGVAVADYDNDGWPDLLVTNFGRNVLYRNLGGGRFENVAARVGVETPGWNTAAAFFDADGDGWLDLYIAQYIDCSLDDVLKAQRTLSWRGLEVVAFGPFGLKGAPDHFFRNVKGRFVDATGESGLRDLALGFGFTPRQRQRGCPQRPQEFATRDRTGGRRGTDSLRHR